MAVKSGVVGGAIESGLMSPTMSNILVGVPFSNIGLGDTVGARYDTTSKTKNHPLTLFSKNKTGSVASAYSDIFYNRILVEPTNIRLGNLISDRAFEIHIFNAYFEEKTFDNIQAYNTEGLSLTGPSVPLTLEPLQEITYDLLATLTGPPQIAAEWAFDFQDTKDDVVIDVTGSRIVLFPYLYKPNMIEMLEWKTSILKSRNGTEQRIKVRQAPRQVLSIETFVGKDEFIRAGNLFYGWRKRDWATPLWTEQRHITSYASTDDLTIYVDTQNGDFFQEGFALIYQNPRSFDVFQISTMTSSSLTMTQGIQNDYDLNSIVVPVKICRMVSNPTRATTGWNAQIKTVFESLTNYDTPAGVASPVQFNGLDVILESQFEMLKTNHNQPVKYEHRIDVTDYGTGVVKYAAPHTYTELVRTVRFFVEDLDNIWDFKKFLHRRAGKVRPFWLPTFEPDFKVTSIGALGPSFLVEDYWHSGQSYQRVHIIVFLNSGSYFFRTIIGADVTASEETEITVDSSMGVDANDIDYISYMGQTRFDTDKIKIKWLQDFKIIADIPTREIKP